ncbi:MAG: 30S ribosomal protein S14 [Patescibacteria group bacterium]|nr:30S ribosomal protein S14 [Patescibacteria group bacterium]
MAKKSQLARNAKRTAMAARSADKRKALKEAGEWEQLQKLPRNASPVRIKNRCAVTGRSRGYMRYFGLSRQQFREMARRGELPGVKKSSW